MTPFLLRTLRTLRNLTRPDVRRTFTAIQQQQWLSHDQIVAMVWEKQQKVVSHAYENCPFYRKKYDAVGFHPSDLKRPDDFARLPIIKKADVRENIEQMVAKGVAETRLVKKFTGGSTGVPVMLFHDKENALKMGALHFRTIGAWGLKQGIKTAHIWGLNPLNEGMVYTRQSAWKRFISNYVLLDAFTMTREKMAGFHQLMRRFRPDLIISYTSAMTAFARHVEENGGAGFCPKAIWLTSEPIHDFQKEVIERVFNSKVYNQYGAVEVFFYAAECRERNGLHINADMRTIEVVDAQDRPVPPGSVGRVVVTDLENYAAPLIRYQNEDMAAVLDRKCACGRGLPLMSEVTGRIYDMFVLPDGSQIYGHRFTTFFYEHVDEVSNFQVHQTHKDRAVVRIVPTERCDNGDIAALVDKRFKEYTGGQMQFEIFFVDEIAKEASGKYRFAKSDVSNSSPISSEGE